MSALMMETIMADYQEKECSDNISDVYTFRAKACIFYVSHYPFSKEDLKRLFGLSEKGIEGLLDLGYFKRGDDGLWERFSTYQPRIKTRPSQRKKPAFRSLFIENVSFVLGSGFWYTPCDMYHRLVLLGRSPVPKEQKVIAHCLQRMAMEGLCTVRVTPTEKKQRVEYAKIGVSL